MGFTRVVALSLIFSFTLVALVKSFPRKTLVTRVIPNESRRSSRLSSVLSDYWSDRGFHEALTDHLLASESQAKDLMLTGDEVEDFRGVPQIRIPRERLTPPSPPRSARTRVRRPRLRLSPATRKQDLEVMESITLVDGGTQLPDGTIQVRPPLTKSLRKYQNPYGSDEISPLSYDLASYKFQRQQQQQHPRQPSLFDTYRTLPLAFQDELSQPPHGQGKPAAYHKAPKSIHQMSLAQFQKQLQNEQPQQYEQPMFPPHTRAYPTSPPLPKPQQQEPVSIFVIQPPQPSPAHPQSQPHVQQQPLRQNLQQQQKPSQNLQQQQQFSQNLQQQPVRQNLQQQQQVAYNAQLFREQFEHPFSPQATEASPLAKFTASLISTASGVAAATSAAANALAQGDAVSPYRQFLPSPQGPSPSISAAATSRFPISVPNPALRQHIPTVESSHQLSPNIILPTTTLSPPSTSLRPGVVADDEQVATQNQLIEPESLAKQLTRIYETGRKILYFPKGVVDTVDTFLKQMERNPMVAYWGDKFFAKVFGDTSGT